MSHMKLTAQTITVLLAGLILTPRLLSSLAFDSGTLAILLFWIAILVILPDAIENFETKKKQISELPKILIITVLICFLIFLLSFYWKNTIYDKNADSFTRNLRRGLYLVNPAICLGLIPLIHRDKLTFYIKKILLISTACSLSILIPFLVGKGLIMESMIKSSTATAALITDFFTSYEIHVESNIYYLGNSHSIQVGSGCASVNQIAFAFQAILLFAICCPIKNKKIYSLILICSFLIAFLLNAFRIFLLGIVTSNEVFEFWHGGQGSLLFSLLVMTCVSIVYYFFWCKENPEPDSE